MYNKNGDEKIYSALIIANANHQLNSLNQFTHVRDIISDSYVYFYSICFSGEGAGVDS